MIGIWVPAKRGFRAAVTAAALAILVGTATDAALGKDTIIIAIPGTPQGVDLDRNVSPQTFTMAAQLWEDGMAWEWVKYPYDTGASFDPGQVPGYAYPNYREQKLTGGLIEQCEISPDGLKATYHLRKGAKSAYGNEFTADDVLWKAEKSIKKGAIYAFIFNAFNMNNLDGWKKVDNYTVEYVSTSPVPLACFGLTNLYNPWEDATEVKKHVTADDPYGNLWIATNGGGFGAYKVASWEAGKRVVMEANPNYWKGAPKIKKIIYQVVPESANRLALLQQGKVDLAEGLSPDEIISLASSDKAWGIGVRGNQSIWMVINNAVPPLDNVKVRQALNHLIPREDIVKNVYRNLATAWQGVMPSSYPGYVPLFEYSFDAAKAKALLAEGGQGNGFEIELAFNAGDPVQENIAVLLQSSFKQAGVKLVLKKLPVAAHSDLVQSRKSQLALWIDFPIQPDPNYSIRLVYDSKGVINYENYKNDEVDKVLIEKVSVVDPAERLKAHEEIQRIIHRESAVGWIAETHFLMGVSKKISGYRWYTTQFYRVADMEAAD